MITTILKVIFYILGFLTGILRSETMFIFLLGVITRNVITIFNVEGGIK